MYIKNLVSHEPKCVQCELTSKKKEMQEHRMTNKICKSDVEKKSNLKCALM